MLRHFAALSGRFVYLFGREAALHRHFAALRNHHAALYRRFAYMFDRQTELSCRFAALCGDVAYMFRDKTALHRHFTGLHGVLFTCLRTKQRCLATLFTCKAAPTVNKIVLQTSKRALLAAKPFRLSAK